MDSTFVSRIIRDISWPFLHNQGFTYFSSRTARRDCDDRIEIINFQSFNSHLAQGIGCTTFSFALNLGIFFSRIPRPRPIKLEDLSKAFRPEEYHCHFRRQMKKTPSVDALKRLDVWSVEPDGSNVEDLVLDATFKIQNDGLPWFERYRSLDAVLEVLNMDKNPPEGTWGFGALASPNRRLMTEYVHLMRGETRPAIEFLTSVVDFKYFASIRQVISDDIENLRSLAHGQAQ